MNQFLVCFTHLLSIYNGLSHILKTLFFIKDGKRQPLIQKNDKNLNN